MKKIHTIIFATTLLFILAMYLFYIEYILPYDHEHIIYPTTSLQSQMIRHDPRALNIEILKDGKIFIDEEKIVENKISDIIKKSFNMYGMDLPIRIHLDKRASIDKIKSIIDEILIAKGIRIQLVAKTISDTSYHSKYYYFSVLIFDSNESKVIVEISKHNIKINGLDGPYEYSIQYLKNRASNDPDENVTIICSRDITCQRLIDILSGLCFTRQVFLKFKENANEITPLDQNLDLWQSGK
jgi:biopolymer transport protein ExbD